MTSGQLFTVPPKLGKRQEFVYKLAGYGPLKAAQAGFQMHILLTGCDYCQVGYTSADILCQYAEREGREVLEALRRKGLLKRDRHHIYRRADQPVSISSPYDPETAVIPF